MNGTNVRAMPDPHMSRPTEERSDGGKRNPLVDLIDSERVYVEQLGLVIRVSIPLNRRLRHHRSSIRMMTIIPRCREDTDRGPG